MKVLIVVCAAIACTLASSSQSYAYSAYAPLGYAYNQLAYSAVPYAYGAPIAAYGAPVAAYGAPVAAYSAPVAVGIKSQYYSDVAGHVSYGHSEPGQSQAVVQDPAGNKVGSFSYVNPEGKVVHTSYVADALGYRVASNDLPVAQNVQPVPVADTPEVAAAKAEFLAQYEAVKSRSRRDYQGVYTLPGRLALPGSYSPTPVVHSATPYASLPVVHSATPYASLPVVHSATPYAPLHYSSPYAYRK